MQISIEIYLKKLFELLLSITFQMLYGKQLLHS